MSKQEKLSLVPVVDDQEVITAASTMATDGNFTITVNGIVTGILNHAAAGMVIKTALEGLSSVGEGNVTVTDGGGGLSSDNGTATIDFINDMGAQPVTVTADFTGLTGNVHVLSNPTPGVANVLVETDAGDLTAQYLILAVSLKMGSTGGIVTFKSRNTPISSAMELIAADHVVLPYNPQGWFSITSKGDNLEVGLLAGDGDVDITYRKLV